MSTLQHNVPLAGRAARTLPVTWWSHLVCVAAAGILGMAVAALFAGVFQLARPLYLVVYVAAVGAFLYAYVRWSGADLRGEFGQHWVWGLIGGAILTRVTRPRFHTPL